MWREWTTKKQHHAGASRWQLKFPLPTTRAGLFHWLRILKAFFCCWWLHHCKYITARPIQTEKRECIPTTNDSVATRVVHKTKLISFKPMHYWRDRRHTDTERWSIAYVCLWTELPAGCCYSSQIDWSECTGTKKCHKIGSKNIMLMLQDVIRTRKPGCDTCYPEYMESARKCMLFVKILLLHFLSCANIELQITLSFHLGSPSVLIKMPLFGIVSTWYSIIELHE